MSCSCLSVFRVYFKSHLKCVQNASQIFGDVGGSHAQLHSKRASLVFCITKVLTKAPVKDYLLDNLRNSIVELAARKGISLEECRDRMVLYDPLDDQDKKVLTALLRTVKPVGENVFQTPLTEKDKILLSELARECSSSICDCMAAKNVKGSRDHWNDLETLNVIQHTAFDQGKISANSVISLLLNNWSIS